MNSAAQAVDIHTLHQQVRRLMMGIHQLNDDVNSKDAEFSDEIVSRGIDELQLDLARLKIALKSLQSAQSQPPRSESAIASVPSLLGGMAMGVILGKLLGSKLQLDLLPFLVGLDLVVGDSVNRSLISKNP